MTKIKKQRKKKTFRHSVNRKRLNKRRKKLPKINCDAIQEEWDIKQSLRGNMNVMGLSVDPNSSMPIVRPVVPVKTVVADTPKETTVVQRLSKEASDRKRKTLRLSQMLVDRLGYFIRKYNTDYRAMITDRLNYDQWTWKQFRAQIKKFMGCKEQWDEYWESIGEQPPERMIVSEHDEDSS